MAGYIPGLLPANHSQEKEFVQAYEDVLERYKVPQDIHEALPSLFTPLSVQTSDLLPANPSSSQLCPPLIRLPV
ncbi:hypothetical protein EOD39_21422 [Acipenser ruthenus]|uniref:Uncharacterized protein n=1 Tax=Acipenser ruthenus TaxID=7906 RepID=A0A444USR0_ACIRT|nr:hypothetical protein EOD39_21422 [Acipenser ruthenus]